MGLDGIVWKLYDISTWLMRLIYLNVLWLLFSILGLVVLGFFPATAAMFSINRKWTLGEKDIPIFKSFWETFKESFVQVNLVGYMLVILGYFLYVDLRFFQGTEQFFISLFSYVIIFSLFIYFCVILYIFPVYVHYQYKTMEYIKYSIVVAMGKPIYTIMMVVGSFLVYLVITVVPVLFLFFGGSLLSMVLTKIAMKSFPKQEIKRGDFQ